MSIRTLIELNHDYCPQTPTDIVAFADSIAAYMSSGDKSLLPKGVTFKWSRHHSDLCPIEKLIDDANKTSH
jgi:hypothetical protein